jgi:hypothetical protein
MNQNKAGENCIMKRETCPILQIVSTNSLNKCQCKWRVVLFTKYYYEDQIKEDETGGAYSAQGGDEKYVLDFGWEAWREETIRKTKAYKGW